MVECPACFGEGVHDMRDMDAFLLEHFTEEEIRAKGGNPHCGIVECTVCQGSGVVTEDVAKDMRAIAVSAIDQVQARMREREAI